MRVLITGATGYIGGRLVPPLVAAGYTVRCVARDPGRLNERFENVEIVQGDVFDEASMRAAMAGCDVAYYLVHSMSDDIHDFSRSDREAAQHFSTAAAAAGVKRIIFLGGLGEDGKQLSKHLRSRHEVGQVLRNGSVPVTEFRAAVIMGSGSVSFEMVRDLVERLPVMVLPRWVSTRIQPIAIRDVIAYLIAGLEQTDGADHIYEIGGRDVLTYKEMMLRFARTRRLKRAFVEVPVLSPHLSAHWIHLVTPIPSSIAYALVEGLRNEVIVTNDDARRAFPAIEPVSYDEALDLALDRNSMAGPESTWFDAYDVKTLPGEFTGEEQGVLIDRREVRSSLAPEQLFRVFTSLGGARGWLYADSLWRLRGLMDRAVGGVGIRRGRRSATSLRIGDAVDFWRVEAYKPFELLRLRAEMKLPGHAWLQFETVKEDDGQTLLRQTAFFEPRGVFGYAYWFSVLPFHELIFGNMAKRIVEEAAAQ
jgi:uncharacterized protein YbjT (DUF2867 family)